MISFHYSEFCSGNIWYALLVNQSKFMKINYLIVQCQEKSARSKNTKIISLYKNTIFATLNAITGWIYVIIRQALRRLPGEINLQ